MKSLDSVARQRAASCDEAQAQRDAYLECLRLLVGYVERVGGFMTPLDQATYWHAKALVAERRP